MTLSFGEEANERRAILGAAWAALPDALRGPTQFLGRQYAGCGATIGVMPRCDFACIACYLDGGSNRARPLPPADVKAQIQVLRRWLGPAGNLQLTDGEITLLPAVELVELVAYARATGLVPMIMTHGETFRSRPGLLERLMTEGGLTEVCFHIDTTMRGRRDHYANAVSENDLDGLRSEFADMIRAARRRTGRRLEAASTVTVTQRNLKDIPGVVRWFLSNADAFKMVSFQPIAAVGRTDSHVDGVSPESLWTAIAEGAGDPLIRRGEGWLGHPACGRFVQGLAVNRRKGAAFVPLYRLDDAREMKFLHNLLERLGGTSFRLDTRSRALRRIAHLLKLHAGFLFRDGVPYIWRLAGRAGTLHARYFCIVSHHFMKADEILSPQGVERRSACVFRVPVDGVLEPMCVVNAGGKRARLYASDKGAAAPKQAENDLVGFL